MTGKTWQTPMFFELDDLDGVAKAAKPTYQAPVVLPDNIKLEEDLDAGLIAQAEGLNSLTANPQDARASDENGASATEDSRPLVLPAWMREKICLPAGLQGASFTPWRWLFAALGGLLLLMLLVDTWYFLADRFAASWLIGSLFLLLTSAIAALSGWLAWRAWQDVRRLRTVGELQLEGAGLMANDGYGHAMGYANRVAHLYQQRADVKPNLDRFFVVANGTHDDGELCTLFSRQVLNPLDEQAYRLVMKRSNETALMVMLSPAPALSTLLTLWRSLRMIRDVATLYGGRPGLIGSTALISTVIHNLIYADVSEMLAESVAETFGGSLVSVLSAQLAQGVGSSVMTARVGLYAMNACRPLPFTEEEKPRLKQIRGEIIKTLKQMLVNRGDKKNKPAQQAN